MTDPDFYLQKRLKRLHLLNGYGRWLLVVVAWLMIAPIALWNLRDEISLLREHFTWVAVRYGLAYHLLPAVSLFFCLGLTISTLLWQVYYSVRGLSPRERIHLENQLKKIERLDPHHPLRKWIWKS
jgi:hypothetical protein